jgi:intracellular sulfur oxidation DsrE/DsrF family protein
MKLDSRWTCAGALAVLVAGAAGPAAAGPPAKAPAVPGTEGYVAIPNAALPPDKAQTYRAVFDATSAAAAPAQILPALNMAGSNLNALAAEDVPLANARFVVVLHGPALDGALDNAHYKAKFGVDNPNLPVLAALRKAGTEIYACGQNMAAVEMDPASLSPDVTVASSALIVLMTYQSKGYALLDF